MHFLDSMLSLFLLCVVLTYCCSVNSSADIRTDAKEGEQQYSTNQESIKEQPPISQQYDPVENWRLDQSAVRQSQLRGPSGWEAQEKPSNATFGPGRPHRQHSEPKGSKMRPKQLPDISVAQTQRRPRPTMPNVSILCCCTAIYKLV